MKFDYRGDYRVNRRTIQVIGVFCILLGTGFLLLFMGKAINSISFHSLKPNLLTDHRIRLILTGLWCYFWFLFLGFTYINMHPTIWTDDRGVTITAFLFFKVFIPWTDIVDVQEVRYGFDRLRFLFRREPQQENDMLAFGNRNIDILIRTRKITPIHYVIGWNYSFAFKPGFLISSGIDGWETLLTEIQRHLPNGKAVIVV